MLLQGHLSRVGPQACTSCRVMVFANKAMATRAHLEEQAAAWLEANDTTPPGNGVDRQLWEGLSAGTNAATVSEEEASTALDTQLMSDQELTA